MPDILDQLRQQYGQAQDQQVDVSSLPELAEQGPRVGKLSKPGLDWLPAATASLKMMISDDPERLAKLIEGTPGVKIGHAAMSGEPYAEINGEKYQFNRKGMSQQDIANFTTTLVTQMGIGKALKIFPALRGTTLGRAVGRETIAGGLTGSSKEIVEQDATGEEKSAGSVIAEGAVGAAGSLVSAVLGSAFGRLFKQGASFLVRGTRELTATARRAISDAGIDPASLDRRTLDQADTILRRQVGSRPTPEEMVRGVAKSDSGETGIPLTQASESGNFADRSQEIGLEQGARGTPAQNVMRQFKEQQGNAIDSAVEGIARSESPGLPAQTERGAGATVRGELQGRASDAEELVQQHYDAANASAAASGARVRSNWDTHGPQFQLDQLGMATVNSGTAPKTNAVINFMQRQFEGASEKARAAARAGGITDPRVLRTIHARMDPAELEGIRKAIGKGVRETSDPTDKAAMVSLRDKFDNFLENEVGSSDPTTLDLYKQARNVAAETKKAFEPQSTADVGGKVIQKTVADNNVDQTLIDSVFGAGKQINPEGLQVYNRLVRTLGGPNSRGAQALRQAMARRVVFGDANAQAKDMPSPKVMVDSINQALEGDGAQFVRQTLGADSLRSFQVLARQLNRAQPPPGLRGAAGPRIEGDVGRAGRYVLPAILGLGTGGGSVLAGASPIVASLAGGAASVVAKKASDAVASSFGRRAAEKAIRQVPILGSVGRLAASARPVTGPIGTAGAGLLPPMGTPTAESLFDTYGPELDLSR